MSATRQGRDRGAPTRRPRTAGAYLRFGLWMVGGLTSFGIGVLALQRPAFLALMAVPVGLAAVAATAHRRAERAGDRLTALVTAAAEIRSAPDPASVHRTLAATSSAVIGGPVRVEATRPAEGDVAVALAHGPAGAWLTAGPRASRGHDLAFLHAAAEIGSAALARADLLEQLGHAALHDPLTGLPNRALLEDRLEQAVARAERSGYHLAVLLVDLDLFKVINDSAGHQVGDRVLVAIAERLRAAVGPEDTVARFGGDEFVLVCNGVSCDWDAALRGERVAAAVAQPLEIDGRRIVVTTSTGIAVMGPGATTETLLREADTAMHQAKRRGRGRTEVFDAGLGSQAHARMEVESALRRALDNHELCLAFQPVVNLDDGRIVGAEALVRWNHPAWGPVPPDRFISVAEESGLIVALGDWVLNEACAVAQSWTTLVPDPVWVSVNLSGRQLPVPGMVESVARALAASKLDPALLVLEMTESVLMAEPDESAATLRALRALGPRLAVDDFGTGYSSLSYLRRFPVNLLKIDGSFVRHLDGDPHDRAIVGAVVALGRALALDILAEGVERSAQAEALRDLSCPLGQGYRFSEAVPAEELGQLLSKGPILI